MNLAAISAVAAGVVMLISGACLVVFFSTEKEAWGRANDATSALFAALMLGPVFELYERYAPPSRWIVGSVTLIAISGICVIVVTSGLTAAGRLHWLTAAKIGAVGFAGVLIWVTSAGIWILRRGGLPEQIAWLGFFTVLAAAVGAILASTFIRKHGTLVGDEQPPASIQIVFALAYVSFPIWLIWLGASL